MIATLILIIVAVVIVAALFVALDYFASALGGDAKIWLLLKGLIVLLALLMVMQRTGLV